MINKFSIIIPIRAQRAPINTVDACLRSLVYNSKLRNQIIIVKDRLESDIESIENDIPTKEQARELKDWLESKQLWFEKHNIIVVDCPKTHTIGNIEIGAYIASNYAIRFAESDWIMLYSDCDFYYHINWDINLINVIEMIMHNDNDAHLKCVYSLIPVRAVSTGEYEEMCRRISVTPGKETASDVQYLGGMLYFDKKDIIKESDMIKYGNRVMESGKFNSDLCGIRMKTSYFPNIINKALINKIGGLGENPSRSFQGDLQYDITLHGHAITRIVPLDALLFHTYKAPIIFDVNTDEIIGKEGIK